MAEWIPAVDNLRQIKEFSLESWLNEQKKRQTLLEKLLQDYNEGRSMSLYCKVCARIPIDLISKTIEKANEKLTSEKADKSDIKLKAKVLKTMFKDLALTT